jgi:hypothetical protein
MVPEERCPYKWERHSTAVATSRISGEFPAAATSDADGISFLNASFT